MVPIALPRELSVGIKLVLEKPGSFRMAELGLSHVVKAVVRAGGDIQTEKSWRRAEIRFYTLTAHQVSVPWPWTWEAR